MALYSYVIARDYGFAPNPFHGLCTLATCKRIIRRVAQVGDWVVGTGSVERRRTGHLVCAMRVTEVVSFDEYWAEPRFRSKRPDLSGSRMQAYGDNIYSRGPGGVWTQEPSHHSLPGGQVNPLNLADDTATERVLISQDFYYFGSAGPQIPSRFRGDIEDICAHRGHKVNFTEPFVHDFVSWLRQLEPGCVGRPDRWP